VTQRGRLRMRHFTIEALFELEETD
jgi:hypothetical protein